jgi:starch synthase
MSTLTPAYDNKIYQKYSKKMLQNKEKNKIAFCQDFGLEYNKKIPLLCLTFPLTEKNNMGMLQDVIEGILEQDVVLAITGIGTKKYQDFFDELAKEHPKRIVIISDNDGNKRKIYAASDMYLATASTEECKEEIEKAMNYGAVPICPPNELVTDYNGAKEEGDGFIYKENSPWSFFAAFIRALENFKFPYDWRAIQQITMSDSDDKDDDEEGDE